MAARSFRNPQLSRDVVPAMKWSTAGGLLVALAVLLYGTVLVFETFDRNSNSASDTIRPFVITMGPVWALVIWAATVILKRER